MSNKNSNNRRIGARLKDTVARFLLSWFIYPIHDFFENWMLTEDERPWAYKKAKK